MRLIELSGPPDGAATHEAWRIRLARLRRAARALWWVMQPIRRRAPAELEFYAEAGAPEGALYENGRLRARLDGIQRL